MSKLGKKNIENIYRLTPVQEGMLFHTLYAPESGMYCEQFVRIVPENTNSDALEQAWQEVVKRHTILRTSFHWEGLEKSQQVVHRQVKIDLARLNFSNLSSAGQKTKLDDFLRKDRGRGFNISEAPLMRLYLIHMGDDYIFVNSYHHLLLDGWSYYLVFEEVMRIYDAIIGRREIHLNPVRPYCDYIAWLKKQDLDKAEKYWRERLKGFSVPTPLPARCIIDRTGQIVEYNSHEILLSEEMSEAIRSFVRQHHLTLSTVYQGVWALLLSRYTGEKDVVFGAVVSGRPPSLPGAESMAGLFINTLPVRFQIMPDEPLIPWLKNIQKQMADLLAYEYSPLVEVQNWSDVPKGEPLFSGILAVETYPVQSYGDAFAQQKDLQVFQTTNYPLTLTVIPESQLMVRITYDIRKFEGEAILRLMGHYQNLLEAMLVSPDEYLQNLPMMKEAECQKLLIDWNMTEASYPEDVTIHQLFEKQVGKSQDNIAVIHGDAHLTYGELDERANQLAHYLREQGVGPDTLVALCLDRSLDMITALLGVLKAGGAYLPIDPAIPEERFDFILKDAAVSHVITVSGLINSALENITNRILLDVDSERIILQPSLAPSHNTTPDNLAYCIYTSGSTGKPKGVLVEHRNVVRLMVNDKFPLSFDSNDVWTMFHSYSFDFSVWEMYGALLYGGKLVIVPREVITDPSLFLEMLIDEKVTVLNQTPSAFYQLINEALNREYPELFLRYVIFGGEALTPVKLGEWKQVYPHIKLINMYGITETTVHVTFKEINNRDIKENISNIGTPIPTTTTYIMDANQRLLPMGVAGELYVGGSGVSRGYLNRDELNRVKFISNPYRPEERLYRSGDFAKLLTNGEMVYMYRIDSQVQIRGFRVEPGEIEATLLGNVMIRNVAVIAREDIPGDKRLVAYVVFEHGTELTVNELRDFLKGILPDYMIPAAFVVLDELPLTPNGKVDRRALPAPEWQGAVEYVTPRTEVERHIAAIWSEVLNIEKVGVFDNFFELGGHSIFATQVLSRIRTKFRVKLPLVALFERPTVESLASRIETDLLTGQGQETSLIQPVIRDGQLPLSFSQQRLWFIDQLIPENPVYNIPLVIKIKGELNTQILECGLDALICRHDSFRTSFQAVDGKPIQVIAPELKGTLTLRDLSDVSEDQQGSIVHKMISEEGRKPFKLSQSPLLRCVLFKLNHDHHLFMVTMHHIISDAWSISVFLNELMQLYQAIADDHRDFSLPYLAVQYVDYVYWQHESMQGEELDRLLAYWKTKLGGVLPVLNLPKDRPRPTEESFQGSVEFLRLPGALTEKLKKLSQSEGVTLFMLLLAAFKVLLFKYSGQKDIIVGSPTANRNRQETEGLIGFFINTMVLRSDLSGNPSFKKFLERVRNMILEAQAHQELPFEKLVDELQPERNLDHNPIFQVMFSLHNTPKPELKLPGLTLTAIDGDIGVSHFDLTVDLKESENELVYRFEYNTDIFNAATISRLMEHYKNLLEEIISNADELIGNLSILSETERRELLLEWNQTRADYPSDRCLNELFEERVKRSPESVALVFEDETLTYAELNRRANQLAHYLREQGVGTEVRVGICMERSIEMVVGLLAILKAGGVYVPLDPEYPKKRLDYMVKDAGVSLLLLQEKLSNVLYDYSGKAVCIDTLWNLIAQKDTSNPKSGVTSKNLMYIIYTSGSTGKPKGVLVAHQGLFNMILAQVKYFKVTTESRVLQFASISFDASISEIFMALTTGASLYLCHKEKLLGSDLIDLLRINEISVVTLPPSLLLNIPCDELYALKTVISAGEACTGKVAAIWAKDRDFFNAYGPTESSVCATIAKCDNSVSCDNSGSGVAGINTDGILPIGSPISNTTCYILDQNFQPVPVGVFGELWIGGDGLARGYCNRPDLTAEKFIPDPFSDEPGARLYRTGDLVCWREGGNIEFLGRVDHQVKVRGFRIELGEIESTLIGYPGIRNATVIAREDIPGDKRLVAYVVFEHGTELSTNQLRDFLKGILPDYMIPAAFVVLDELPLTPNGKVDRRVLPFLVSEKPSNSDFRDKDIQTAGKKNIHDWYYIPVWKQTPIPSTGIPERGHRLIFLDDDLLGIELVRYLEDMGQTVIKVKSGKKYKKLDDLSYVLRFSSRYDCEKLFADLMELYERIPCIIHMGALGGKGIKDFDKIQNKSLSSLICLAQALEKRGYDQEIQIDVITNDAQRVTGEEKDLHPEQAIVFGVSKIIPQEYSNINCRIIDLSLSSKKIVRGEQIKQAATEIIAGSPERNVAYRGRNRWIQEFEQLQVAPHEANRKKCLQREGIYMITGGLGKTGLILSRYLSENYQARLVLITRAEFPDQQFWQKWLDEHSEDDFTSQKIRMLRGIEEGGGRLLILSADVVDQKAMRKVIRRTYEKFGAINGIIHGAEISRKRISRKISETNSFHCNLHFRAKVRGIAVLEKVLKDETLDFCLLMSSLSAIAGGSGKAASASADCFMDSWAHKKDGPNSNSFPWISVNWDNWLSREMNSSSTRAIPGILPDEIGDVLEHVLAPAFQKVPQVVVSTTALENRLKEQHIYDYIPEEQASAVHNRPNLLNPYVAPSNQLEEKIVKIWERVLGLNQVGIHDNYFELGGNSLLGIQIVARLREAFQLDLANRIIIDGPTVSELSILVKEKKAYNAMTEFRTPLVELQSRGTEPPLFFVHPMDGGVMCYKRLAMELGTSRPFYGIEAPARFAKCQPFGRIEEMAAHYLKFIEEKQPDGPYYLGGWSFGGVVAFEMARQLQKIGKETALLCILDAHAPVILAKNMPPITMLSVAVLFEHLDVNGDIRLPLSDVLELDSEELLNYTIELIRTSESFNDGATVGYYEAFLNLYLSHLRSILHYQPPEIAQDVLLLKASDSSVETSYQDLMKNCIFVEQISRHTRFRRSLPILFQKVLRTFYSDSAHTDHTLCWKNFTTGNVQVWATAGSHENMVDLPYVQEMAKIIKKFFARNKQKNIS